MTSFFETFEHLGSCFKIGKRDMLKILKQMLTGKALRAFSSMPPSKINSYGNLKLALIERFGVSSSASNVRFKYNKRTQSQSESVESFYEDLFRLGSLAHPDFSSDQLEKDLLDHFLDGPKPEIGKFVLCLGYPEDLSECLQRSKNIESAYSHDNLVTPEPSLSVNEIVENSKLETSAFDSTCRYSDELKEEIQQLTTKIHQLEMKRDLVVQNKHDRDRLFETSLDDNRSNSQIYLPDNYFPPTQHSHRRTKPFESHSNSENFDNHL